jgi:hypothetical protein
MRLSLTGLRSAQIDLGFATASVAKKQEGAFVGGDVFEDLRLFGVEAGTAMTSEDTGSDALLCRIKRRVHCSALSSRNWLGRAAKATSPTLRW